MLVVISFVTFSCDKVVDQAASNSAAKIFTFNKGFDWNFEILVEDSSHIVAFPTAVTCPCNIRTIRVVYISYVITVSVVTHYFPSFSY
jgi:hypothetical protein